MVSGTPAWVLLRVVQMRAHAVLGASQRPAVRLQDGGQIGGGCPLAPRPVPRAAARLGTRCTSTALRRPACLHRRYVLLVVMAREPVFHLAQAVDPLRVEMN